jgi:hypothetical protein
LAVYRAKPTVKVAAYSLIASPVVLATCRLEPSLKMLSLESEVFGQTEVVKRVVVMVMVIHTSLLMVLGFWSVT